MADDDSSDARPGPGFDTSVPHSARVWNYWLGGKDNFEVDRQLGDQIREMYPDIVDIARVSRAFLVRAVRYLTAAAGVRQFLDIGTGLPTADNTHEVAQAIAPECRVVYVDNDPLVLVHARALLTSAPEGVTEYIDADVRDPDAILREAARTLDFSQPVALMLLGILGNVADTAEASAIVDRLVDALPSGSFVALNDGTNTNQAGVDAAEVRGDAGDPYTLRSPEQIARFLDGLEVVEPGVVSTPRWRPDPDDTPVDLGVFCAVARKP